MRIECSECHKFYEYPADEICPRCGAYNKPKDAQTAVSSTMQQPKTNQSTVYGAQPPSVSWKNFKKGTAGASQKLRTAPFVQKNSTSNTSNKKVRTGIIVGIVILACLLIQSLPQIFSAVGNLLDSSPSGTMESATDVVWEIDSSAFTKPAQPQTDHITVSEEESAVSIPVYQLPEENVRIAIEGGEMESNGILFEYRALGDVIEPTEDYPFRYVFLDLKATVSDRDTMMEYSSYAFDPCLLADDVWYSTMNIENLTDLSEYSPLNLDDLQTLDEVEGQLFYCIPENVEALSIYDIMTGSEWVVGSYSDF